MVITKGGTYTGNWESRDSEIPAVEVRTSEPVTIINSTIRGAGYLIKSWGHDANITIKHTSGYGLTPTPWSGYIKSRRFLTIDHFRNVVVENCNLNNTAGIYIGENYTGNGTPANSIKIRYNKAYNIDGRTYNGIDIVQFVQFNYKGEVPAVEIAWNQVINEPDKSAVEDNINIFNSRGTPDSPMRIHNNYIQGAYPYPANSNSYSGGGILTDSPGTDSARVTAFVMIHDNQLVGLGNHCIGIAGGNNIEVCNNRAVVAASFQDSTPFPFWTSGIWARDYYKGKLTYGNSIHHNQLAVLGRDRTWRNDVGDSTQFVASVYDNEHLPDKVTINLEAREFTLWQQKLKLAGIKLGPQNQ
ncbi:glycosyl hydrolase [Pontibacter sp. BT213]|uniref:Glycosyl hydrolase n=1 Tax=Pontibacter fetidus TaxID=2700082 RepID=A0A6B2H7F3_9BACT|nr:glycosyl hydrolase [Pontibacter fetidus]